MAPMSFCSIYSPQNVSIHGEAAALHFENWLGTPPIMPALQYQKYLRRPYGQQVIQEIVAILPLEPLG